MTVWVFFVFFLFRQAGRYFRGGESCSRKPPNPEQSLTPLQQKEVRIEPKGKQSGRNLRANVKKGICFSSEMRVRKIYSGALRWGESWQVLLLS